MFLDYGWNYKLHISVYTGLINRFEDYVYSNLTDYTEEKGLLDDIIVFLYYG